MEKLIRGFLRRSRSKPGWTITGIITAALVASNPPYGIAFFLLTAALWLSYMYGLHKGETEMHCRMSTKIRQYVLIPLTDVKDQLREEEWKPTHPVAENER